MRWPGRVVALGVVLTAPALADQPAATSYQHPAAAYQDYCARCHGPGAEGSEPFFPSLLRVTASREPDDVMRVVLDGKFDRGGELDGHTIPLMPPKDYLPDQVIAGIVNYLYQQAGQEDVQISASDVARIRAEGAAEIPADD